MLTYHIIFKKDSSHWQLYDGDVQDLRFEWYLVKLDQYGNTMFIKQAGEGPSLELYIPHDPQYYKLYVEAVSGDDIRMINTILNTPFE
jgi:hypothetical protein